MKELVTLVILAAIAAFADGALEPGLRIKFDLGFWPNEGSSYFFNISRTVSEAQEAGWTRSWRPRSPTPYLPQLKMYCASDKIVCAFYNDLNDVAGLQIALPVASFSDNALEWEARGFQLWNTTVTDEDTGTSTCQVFRAIQQFFHSEEYMQKSKAERLALRDPDAVLQEKAVWLTGINREMLKVANEDYLVNETLFTKQGCVNWMGTHYYYNMSESLTCEPEKILSWFPMVDDGELVATGFMTFGSLPTGSPDWFERPPWLAVKYLIVPDGSDCFWDLAWSPGALTMHIYYTRTPWEIDCD